MVARILLLAGFVFANALSAQIIEFESGGLTYRTLTRGGVTIMWAHLPIRVRNYAVLQVSISNGSRTPYQVKPEDFRFEGASGRTVAAAPASTVVQAVMKKASRGDVIKLLHAYEAAFYGNARMHSTNGYESRRQDAAAEMGGGKLRAGAAASAIAFGPTKLLPTQSTDGAIFFPNGGRPLANGKLIVMIASETFEFPVGADAHARP